jgi:ABC-2 type transport system ATP-binding protein
VSLIERADALVGRLSGGERARVSLAAALLGSPSLLVLDEPTVGLDPVLRDELWSVFRRLAEQGVTLLVSSHVMDEADRCQRLLLLREGMLLADSTPSELRQRTKTENLDQAFLRLIGHAEAA